MQVHEVMSKDVQFVSPDTKINEVARSMRESDIGAIPVCESDRLVGMVTDRDIVVRAGDAAQALNDVAVSEVMSKKIITCRDTDSLEDVARLMREHQVRRIPVLDESKQVVGIISLSDLARQQQAGKLAEDALEGISEESGDSRQIH